MGQDYYGVFPLQEDAEIQNIKKILGLQHGKIYENVKELRYGHLMIMADQVCASNHYHVSDNIKYFKLFVFLIEHYMCFVGP